MVNTVEDKKRASQPRLDLNRIFYENWLIFSKTQLWIQNGVRSSESLLSTKNNVKHSLGQKRSSQPRLDSKRIFDNKWLIFSKAQVLTQNGVRPIKPLLSTENNEKHSLGQKRCFPTKNWRETHFSARNG